MLTAADWTALVLTLQLALVSCLILFLIGTPLAWWLSRAKSAIKPIIEAIIALPLVLPPTVLGFYLLILLSKNGAVGSVFYELFGSDLAFSFTGLVVGSVIYSLPFVIQPLHSAFSAVRRDILETASSLGASAIDRFFTIVLPLTRQGFLTAAVLGFAHTLGEFGVVLMLGGNIPGETRVVSIAIYEHVESLQYANAHALSAVLLCVSFVLLVGLYAFNRRSGQAVYSVFGR
ncbi:MAG: molybdate ABC transporter permease subunit [Pseudomonadota bacterium]